MDVAQWKRLHITQDIEKWMGKYRESKKDLIEIVLSFAYVFFQPEVIRLQIRIAGYLQIRDVSTTVAPCAPQEVSQTGPGTEPNDVHRCA